MKKLTKVLAAIMLMCATMFVAGCEREDDIEQMPISQPPQSDWVDLGLPSGLLWASRNVGANTQEQYGDYYAWGETQPKTEYSWITYRFCLNGDYHHLTKYCRFLTDTVTVLRPEDDAATANWGGGARIPTKAEWKELVANTTCCEAYRNEVRGILFTGSNGNSIFLPNAGYLRGLQRYEGFKYWSSSLNVEDFDYLTAWGLNGGGFRKENRYLGLSVRAVRSAR